MKIGLRILIILTALGVVLLFAKVNFSQTNKLPSVGVYKTVSVEDAKVIEAAEFAIAKQAIESEVSIELLSIESAETQVVAGTNYRFCMQIKAFANAEDLEEDEDVEDITGFAKIVVFKNLKNEFLLRSWVVVENCGKK